MSSPKSGIALRRLGHDLRSARLRRAISVADLAERAGISPSTIARLEKGDPGVGIGTLSDILVVFGLAGQLGELIDIRKDELGLALDTARLPRRGRSSSSAIRRRKEKNNASPDKTGDIDRDGVGF